MQDVLTRNGLRAVVLALTAAAIVVPMAQAKANVRPLAGLERFYVPEQTFPVYGIGDNMSVYNHRAAKSSPVYGIGDNMSFYSRHASKATAKKTQKTTKAVRPDDRAGIRGIGSTKVTVVNDTSDVMSRALNRWLAVHPRPDDRAGIRGIGFDTPEAYFGHWEKRIVLQ
jgi:hypothetical protein